MFNLYVNPSTLIERPRPGARGEQSEPPKSSTPDIETSLLRQQRVSSVLQQPVKENRLMRRCPRAQGRPAYGTRTHRVPTNTRVTLGASWCPFRPRPCQDELGDGVTSAAPALRVTVFVPSRFKPETRPSQALLERRRRMATRIIYWEPATDKLMSLTCK